MGKVTKKKIGRISRRALVVCFDTSISQKDLDDAIEAFIMNKFLTAVEHRSSLSGVIDLPEKEAVKYHKRIWS